MCVCVWHISHSPKPVMLGVLLRMPKAKAKQAPTNATKTGKKARQAKPALRKPRTTPLQKKEAWVIFPTGCGALFSARTTPQPLQNPGATLVEPSWSLTSGLPCWEKTQKHKKQNKKHLNNKGYPQNTPRFQDPVNPGAILKAKLMDMRRVLGSPRRHETTELDWELFTYGWAEHVDQGSPYFP